MASFAQVATLVYAAVLGPDSASAADLARLAFGALLWIVLVILNRGAAGASPRPSAFEDGVVPRVPLAIDSDPEMLEAAARLLAHRSGAFADPAREDERVDSTQHRGERADVLAEHIAEELDRLGRVRLGRAGLEERLHIGCRARHAEEAGLVVDEAFDRAGIESLVREQVHEHAGVEVAAPRTHHEAARRREAHGRIDGKPVAHWSE